MVSNRGLDRFDISDWHRNSIRKIAAESADDAKRHEDISNVLVMICEATHYAALKQKVSAILHNERKVSSIVAAVKLWEKTGAPTEELAGEVRRIILMW
jgi:hypothetical protein